jgi:hypothetical protein
MLTDRILKQKSIQQVKLKKGEIILCFGSIKHHAAETYGGIGV